MSKLSLGKGLSSLLGSDEGDVFGEDKKADTLKLAQIEVNINQPRKNFDDEPLTELCESIKVHGVLSPILVREISQNRYQIIAGERRFRASKLAGLSEVPVRIIDADDKKCAEIALIENLQREDLNTLEEALGYKELMEKYDLTQEQVSKSVSKSRSSIANAVRLLVLPQEILDLIKDGLLSSGHARAILSLVDEKDYIDFAKYIINRNLNVRQAEAHAKKINQKEPTCDKEDNEYSIYFNQIEDKMEESLCRKVKIVYNKSKINGKGKIELEYFNNEDLENLIDALSSIKM